MSQPNTVFLIARFGLKGTGITGILESWMWILDPLDFEMKHVSFHKTKSGRAYKGGEILGFRDPTLEEYEEHQEEMRRRDEGQMKSPDERTIILFKPYPRWKELWPQSAKSHTRDYKALGYVSR